MLLNCCANVRVVVFRFIIREHYYSLGFVQREGDCGFPQRKKPLDLYTETQLTLQFQHLLVHGYICVALQLSYFNLLSHISEGFALFDLQRINEGKCFIQRPKTPTL